jgi:cytochrome c556
MKKILVTVLTTLSLSVFSSPATDAVEYRQAVFKLVKANFANMGAMMKGKKPFNSKEFNKNAMNLKSLSSMPWEFFAVEGSDMVDASKAKDEIWDESKKFKGASKYFKKVVATLDKTATPKSNIADVKSAFTDVAKTCKGCHKKFKQK